MQAALQMQTEQMMMTYILSSSIQTAVSYPAKASVVATLAGLKKFLELQRKSTANPEYAAHIDMLLMRCKEPEKATPTIYLDAPPGAPIGCEDLF